MQIGVFQLLQALRDQLEAGRNYVATLTEYWRSRAALEQILAGRLVASLGVMSRAPSRGSAMPSGGAASGGGH
jgi:predicted aldo/keto reductase-like oxidoreductase